MAYFYCEKCGVSIETGQITNGFVIWDQVWGTGEESKRRTNPDKLVCQVCVEDAPGGGTLLGYHDDAAVLALAKKRGKLKGRPELSIWV